MEILSLPAGRLKGLAPLTAEEMAAYVVAAAVWAPSVHNTQPWWFSAARQEISLHADAGRQLMVADPCGRELMISCGAALFTARLALRSLGYIPETSVLPDPGRPFLVARVSWQRRAAATEYEQRLFSQVLRRRTHRGGFDPLPLSPDLLAVLQAGAERDRAMLRIVADEGSRAVLAAVVETAERALRLDGAYVRELAGGRHRRVALGATGCRTPPTQRVLSASSRTSPAGTSPMAADGASPCPSRQRRLGPPVSCAC